jgi:hypothetical protein
MILLKLTIQRSANTPFAEPIRGEKERGSRNQGVLEVADQPIAAP